MTNQNPYAFVSADPAEYNKQLLKQQLAITLIQLIRMKGWSQTVASENLAVSQPRVSNLMRGKIDRFSLDAIAEMIFRAGYKFDFHLDFDDPAEPCMEMKMKKAML